MFGRESQKEGTLISLEEKKKQVKTKYESANYMLEWKYRSFLLSGEGIGRVAGTGRWWALQDEEG